MSARTLPLLRRAASHATSTGIPPDSFDRLVSGLSGHRTGYGTRPALRSAMIGLLLAAPLHAQGMPEHMAMAPDASPLGIPTARLGSGTSWLPDATPMHALHASAGAWSFMLHGAVFPMLDAQGSRRGDTEFGIVNWGMLMASRPAAGGVLRLRTMLSLEPLTLGRAGYPLLLQTGETVNGAPLHDRQHPHDLFMELSALYERALSPGVGISLFVAPVGEPSAGPVAFPHRPSAAADPLAPLAHHWQDATHISFGVLTAGVFTKSVKLEGSVFNGREPDEDRYNFDYAGRSLDSWSTRLAVNPARRWSLSVSWAHLKSPESLAPDESVDRLGAAILYVSPQGARPVSAALIYGGNQHEGEDGFEHSVTAEATVGISPGHQVFSRLEWIQKGTGELVLPGPDATHDIGAITAGYLATLGRARGLELGAGIRGSVGLLPEALHGAYGSRTPVGAAVYLRLRPAGGHP